MWSDLSYFLSIMFFCCVLFALGGCESPPDCRDLYLFSTPMGCEYKKIAPRQRSDAHHKKSVKLSVIP